MSPGPIGAPFCRGLRLMGFFVSCFLSLTVAGLVLGGVPLAPPKVHAPRLGALSKRPAAKLPARPLGEDPGLGPDIAPLRGQKSARLAWYRERYGSEAGPGHVDEVGEQLRSLFLETQATVRRDRLEGSGVIERASALVWQHVGPLRFPSYPFGDANAKPGSGRILGVYVNAVDPKLLYTFSEGAGLWRCRNADLEAPTTWIWERIGVGLVNSASKVWVNPQAPSVLLFGKGRDLYGSVDQGSTWLLRRAFTDNLQGFCTPDGVTLFAAAAGGGLWKSTDQGSTWAAVTVPGASLIMGLQALEGGVLLVHGGAGANSASGTHIFRSTDKGNTWTRAVWTGTMADPATRRYPLSFLGGGKAAYVRPGGTMPLHRSDDGGLTWNPRPLDPGQGDPGGIFAADPTNPDVLFANYFELNRSLDGGRTWLPFNTWAVRSDLPSIHADQHSGAFSLAGPQVYLSGNDGGLAVVKRYTLDPKELKARQDELIEMRPNAGLGNSLLYVVGATGADRNAWILGTQDHGTLLGNGRTRGTGDGLSNKVHPKDPLKMLSEGYGDNLARSINGGASWSSARAGITTSNNWSTQLYLGAEPDTVYYTNTGGAWRSADWGLTWTAVKLPDFATGWKLRGFAAAPSDGQRLAFTVSGASSWGFLSKDQGASWTPFGSLPGAAPWWVVFHPQQADTLFATSSNPSGGNRLFRSRNGGTSWTALDTTAAGWPSGAVPDQVVIHPLVPSWIIVGTTFGLLESRDDGASWQVLGGGFPSQQATDLFMPADGTWMRATTWGMGMWDLDLAPALATFRPVFTLHPASQSLRAGQGAILSASAQSTLALRWQWRKDGADLPGATGPELRLTALKPTDSGRYEVVATNDAGSMTSQAATLTVLATLEVPVLTTQPASLTVKEGEPATFLAEASGSAPLAWQWRKDGLPIPGATGGTLRLAAVKPGDAGSYGVQVSNSAGQATSQPATLTVVSVAVAPVFSLQPQGLTVLEGQPATLVAAATGSAPLAWQWSKDGAPLPGATGPSLVLPATRLSDAGVYTARVTNAVGQAVSQPALLAVTPLKVSLILPRSRATLLPGAALVLRPQLLHATDPTIQWTVQGGGALETLATGDVRFTAPQTPGPVTLLAASRQDPTATATLRITVFGSQATAFQDLGALAEAWGLKGEAALLDLNQDDVVDDADLLLLLEFLRKG